MVTQPAESENMRLISHVDLKGRNNIGEGVNLHQTAGGGPAAGGRHILELNR